MTRCISCQIAATAEALGKEPQTIRTLFRALDVAANDKLQHLLAIAALKEHIRELEATIVEKDELIHRQNQALLRRKAHK